MNQPSSSEAGAKPARLAVFRFAPSPTGLLHLGGVRVAALNWLAARQEGGQFLLRLEDTDVDRGTVEFEQDLSDGLSWLGLKPDEAPPTPHFRQSENMAFYDEALNAMLQAGRAYGCDCSPERLDILRKSQAKRGLPPRYDGKCRELGLSPEAPNTVRFKVMSGDEANWEDFLKGPQHFTHKAMGDFVVRTSTGRYLFDLASVVDDARMKVSHVLRGEDHLANTARHRLEQAVLGYDPPGYGHLPLIRDAKGAKISKRDLEADSVGALRQRGYLPQAVVLYCLDLGEGGIREEHVKNALTEEGDLKAAELPSWRALARTGGRMDLSHLDHFQKKVLHALPGPGLKKALSVIPGLQKWVDALEVETLREFAMAAPMLPNLLSQFEDLEKGGNLEGVTEPAVLDALQTLAQEESVWQNADAFKKAISEGAKKAGLKPAALFQALRHVLAARHDGPALYLLVSALGIAAARQRLLQALGA